MYAQHTTVGFHWKEDHDSPEVFMVIYGPIGDFIEGWPSGCNRFFF